MTSVLATHLTWRAYLRTSATVGTSMCIGDITCQQLTAPPLLSPSHESSSSDTHVTWDGEKRTLRLSTPGSAFVWDVHRTSILAFVSACINSPIGHTWQVALEHHLPGNAVRTIACKIIGNATMAFFISLPLMFTSVTLLNGGTWADASKRIDNEKVPVFTTGLAYWPFANLIAFRYFGVQNRAIVNSCFGVLWNIYLSFHASKPVQTSLREQPR